MKAIREDVLHRAFTDMWNKLYTNQGTILEPVSYTHLDVYKRQELTLLDFLEQAEGKNQNLADKQIALAGGGTLKFTILTSGGYGVQIQSQGAVSYTHLDVYKRQSPCSRFSPQHYPD